MKQSSSSSDPKTNVLSRAPLRPDHGSIDARNEISRYDPVTEYLSHETDFARVLFDQLTGYAIIAADFDGNVVAFNEGAQRIFGYAPDDVIGRERVDAFFPRQFIERGELHKAIADALGGKQYSIEDEMRRRGDKKFPAHVTMAATQDKARRIVGFVLLVEDITERKEAQETIERMNAELEGRVRLRTAELQTANLKLEESEHRFRAILETALDGIVLVDIATGKFLMGNPASCHLLGYSPGELVGVGIDDIHPRKAVPAIKQALYQGMLAEARLDGVELLRRNGTTLFADIVTSPMTLAERKLCVAIMHDVTEHRRQEERIREEVEKFRAVVEQNVAGIVIISSEGRFLYANPFFCASLGYAPHELIGENVEVVVVETDRERVAEFHRSFPYGSSTVLQVAGTVVTKDGRKIDMLANESGIIYGGKSAALAVVIDVSERKRSEEALRRALQRTISAIVSTTELRDPFTGGHQRRVAALSTAIAKEMGVTEDRVEGIDLAASVHDIGKVVVPVELLSYPGKLTPKQFALIQEHARAGYEILKDIEFPWPIATIVLQHHERLDGSGYPQGLKGEAILAEAKILAVADVVEAMLSHRPYRPALGLDAALNEIEMGKGRLYDPAAVAACIKLFREMQFSFTDKAVA